MRTGQTLSLASSAEQALIIYNRVLHTILNNETLKKRFSKTTERRGIVSADGLSRYDVKAMKESALQGIPLDTVLADELHLWKKGAWSAVVLGTSTKPDGIVIGITTAGDESSETLLDLYAQGQRAANGDPELERFGFFNWTAPEGADVKDPGAILASNPAVECGRIPLERIMADLATIPEHEARRYRLNQFVTGTTDSWLPGELFHQCAGNGISETEGLVLGIDITLRWEYATIAGANNLEEMIETELISSFVQPTENQLYDTITALCRKYKVRGIGIDGQRAPNLVKRLKLNGFPVWQLYSKEVAAACSQGYAMFETKKIAHNNDPLLIAQIPRGVAKYVGESCYLSRRLSFGDIDAVLATLFAVYVAASKEDSSIGVF
jgi:phage terminase large subunit-like protein